MKTMIKKIHKNILFDPKIASANNAPIIQPAPGENSKDA